MITLAITISVPNHNGQRFHVFIIWYHRGRQLWVWGRVISDARFHCFQGSPEFVAVVLSSCQRFPQFWWAGVGKCPILGILDITFKYLLEIISPILGWCSIGTFNDPWWGFTPLSKRRKKTGPHSKCHEKPPWTIFVQGEWREKCQDLSHCLESNLQINRFFFFQLLTWSFLFGAKLLETSPVLCTMWCTPKSSVIWAKLSSLSDG